MQTRDTINSYLNQCLAEYCFSGYQFQAKNPSQDWKFWGGRTSHWPDSLPVDEATYFDIGSLTKVVVTTSVLARAYQHGEIALEDPIRKFLPSFVGGAFAQLQIQECLTHSTGLKAWAPLYRELEGTKLENWFNKQGHSLYAAPVRTQTEYSDIGMLLLKLVLERVWGNVEVAFQQEVVGALGLTEVVWGPLKHLNCAATEVCSWRKKLIQGEPFDENTAALGGVSSHAGLFATARGLSKFADAWLEAVKGSNSWLREEVAKKFTARANLVSGSTWALGWDTKSQAFSSFGDYFSADSFGHLGYPGTSLWIDPKSEVYSIFLTNRVHPSRVDERIKKIRPELHNQLAQAFGVIP